MEPPPTQPDRSDPERPQPDGSEPEHSQPGGSEPELPQPDGSGPDGRPAWAARQGRGGRLGSRRRRVLVGLLGLAVALGGVWLFAIPYPWGLDTENPAITSLIEQRLREARLAGEELEIRQEWVPLGEISPRLVRAVIVAEDYRFREHRGIDWVSLAEEVQWSGDDDFSWLSPSDLGALRQALAYAWSHRDEIRGRSTITQQLAKNLYFGTDRTLLRKAMEFVVAKRLERHLTKDRILELYLNIAEWGPGIFGVQAASDAYFGRSASSLALEEAAALAATLPHPLTSNPRRSPGRMAWRRELILDRIDPARAMPTTPIPLPEPILDPDFGISEMGPDVGRMLTDSLAPDSLRLDSTGAPVVDTGTAPPDSMRVRGDTTCAPGDTTCVARDRATPPSPGREGR